MVEFVVGFVFALFVLSLLAEPIARWTSLPQSAVLVLLGSAVAYFVTLGLGVDTGLRASGFHDLVFFVFLPVLIFEAAFKIPTKLLMKDLGVILFFASIAMLLTTVISAALLYWGIGHPTGFPWIAALLTGALLAATDPVAVVAQLKTLGAPERLGVILEGESLFNDATAIVTFSFLLTLALMPTAEVNAWDIGWGFMLTVTGGVLIGAAVGFIGAWLIRPFESNTSDAVITLAAAYGSFLIAESVFHVSGVLASLVAGLLLARTLRRQPQRDIEQIDFFWTVLAYAANGSVFLLVGVTITIEMFQERWLAMIIAIAAILVARTCATYGGVALLNPTLDERIPANYRSAMVWGGLRGAVTLALALSLPVELEYWWTIQSMAFGVVLFTLFVQAPSTPKLLSRTGLVKLVVP